MVIAVVCLCIGVATKELSTGGNVCKRDEQLKFKDRKKKKFTSLYHSVGIQHKALTCC
jgi:hypothetical protein